MKFTGNGLGYKLSCDTGVQFFHLSQGVATRVYEIGFIFPPCRIPNKETSIKFINAKTRYLILKGLFLAGNTMLHVF